MTKIAPTTEQLAFCKEVWEGRPCFLSARAGTGKTSTIKMVFEEDETGADYTVVAFNNKNAAELQQALPPKVKVATLHSLGFQAIKRFLPSVSIDQEKLYKLVKDAGIRGVNAQAKFRDTMRLVSCAKNWGIVPKEGRFKHSLLEDSPETWLTLLEHFQLWDADPELAREILLQSNQQVFSAQTIDFDDMIYLPVALGLQVFTTSKMLVDEAQDLSPLNLAMLKKTPSKIWYVGDPFQAIYAWRGAEANVLEELGLPEFPLTRCWRCAKKIIQRAQVFVPDIRAWDEAPVGEVNEWMHLPDWTQHKPATVLSRNNAGLIKIALQLQENGQSCTILGKDFGQELRKVLAKLKGTTQKQLLESLLAWKHSMCEKYPHQRGKFLDITQCMQFLIAHNHGKSQIEREILKLFSDFESPGAWVLSTIHKAKGLEWKTVWILDWSLSNGMLPWQTQEERNLKYVATTRAKEILNIIKEEAWEIRE